MRLPKMLSNTAIIEAMNARRHPLAFLGPARKTGQYAISIEAPIADDMQPQRQPDAGAQVWQHCKRVQGDAGSSP
ncbi:hypothetical protein BMG00_16555 [Thioclava marina]|uniref:Uncharacterized protein n=1 Tax=Thioclava marina TaxID=1915077 RepID=A0ABX3MIP5_9RHOB|nr:hypothetical protein BMG00_16555 [Thioclava marina]